MSLHKYKIIFLSALADTLNLSVMGFPNHSASEISNGDWSWERREWCVCVCVCVCVRASTCAHRWKLNTKNGLVGPWSQTSQEHHREKYQIDSRPRYCDTVGPPYSSVLHLWIQSTIDKILQMQNLGIWGWGPCIRDLNINEFWYSPGVLAPIPWI